ncbi:MAG: hypothetical protein KC486_10940 [Myxococcales bacterium]|nr:hypothetical protein [Myxococcales bacterium]
MAKSIETRTEVITFGNDGIVRCKVKPTEAHTLADAEENVRATAELTEGRRLPLILDARKAKGITREAREYYTGPANAAVVMATAMIIDSSVGKIIGNFLIRVNRPPFPFRLFSDEDSAYAWLVEIRAAHADDAAGAR